MIDVINLTNVSTVLSEMVAKLKSKQMRGACIEAELCRVTSSIRVSNITEHYEEDYLRVYFENPMTSGGGKVTSVELLGNGQAVVIFNDPKGKKLQYYVVLDGLFTPVNCCSAQHHLEENP